VSGDYEPIDQEFLDDFATLSSFGATPAGGVDREAGSPADLAQRAWFAQWLTDRGFRVHTDDIGNLFGMLEWVPGAPVVLTGSHLDSQPLGGRYDGAYGVLASAHAAHRLNQKVAAGGWRPSLNLAVVDWFNEEGSRFTPSMMGSSVFTGKLAGSAALATTDAGSVTVAEAMADSLGQPWTTPVQSYAEIHVEQGRILEDTGVTIGLVTATWAAQKFDVVVTGEQSHTGSTVMADRHDALVGAARLVVAVRELAERFADAPLHTSVGRFDVLPNSPVVVPREVRLNIDLRSPDPAAIAAAVDLLRTTIAAVSVEVGVEIDLALSHAWDQQPYPAAGVSLAAAAAQRLGLSHQEMMTIAGHDSTNLKDQVPTVMLFVPSVGGVAHNEGELTADEDCLAGVALLSEVLTDLCSEAPAILR
jgi:beta-ureidopropionase / N-carbamoyl-L-amino-acid hydrolase